MYLVRNLLGADIFMDYFDACLWAKKISYLSGMLCNLYKINTKTKEEICLGCFSLGRFVETTNK